MPTPIRLAVLVVAVLAIGVAAGRATLPEVPEYQLKAEFLERFTRFVEWPESALTGSKFVIGVIGEDPFGGALDTIARDRRIKELPVEIRHVRSLDDVSRCQVLFIAGSEDARLERILGRAAGHPVLTVGDTPGFGRRGVDVNFYPDGERIGFEVNLHAAEGGGLVVSARLLKLARLVGSDAP